MSVSLSQSFSIVLKHCSIGNFETCCQVLLLVIFFFFSFSFVNLERAGEGLYFGGVGGLTS